MAEMQVPVLLEKTGLAQSELEELIEMFANLKQFLPRRYRPRRYNF
jgi:hypothetical protein